MWLTKPIKAAQFIIGGCFLIINLTACTPKNSSAPPDLAQRGKDVYIANCIACHNADPSKAGTIGPAVKGSSLELIKARVLSASYPEGYKPQRDTKLMLALPHLDSEISAIYTFLNK
jgi:mono/diheme cytochrome c family protein